MAKREGWTLGHHVFSYYEGVKRLFGWEAFWHSNLGHDRVVASGVERTRRQAEKAAEQAKQEAASSCVL